MISSDTILNNVEVQTTQYRGATKAEIADRALNKILTVGQNSHPALREQAMMARDQIREVLEFYMHEMVSAEHTNVANRLTLAGYPELIPVALGEK